MKKLFITFLLIAGCTAVNAQQAKQEIFENINLSASNYLAYPGPTQEKLTPEWEKKCKRHKQESKKTAI